jgi:phage shock protein C
MKCDYGCHNKLYRDPDNGKIAGVCAGIADYFSWNVNLVRIVTVILAITFTLLTVSLYAVGAIFLQPKPRNLYDDQEEETYWRRYRKSPRNTMSATQYKFRKLEKKLRKLEAYMTSSKYNLDREFNKMGDK